MTRSSSFRQLPSEANLRDRLLRVVDAFPSRRVLVVGGGEPAARKVELLLSAGAGVFAQQAAPAPTPVAANVPEIPYDSVVNPVQIPADVATLREAYQAREKELPNYYKQQNKLHPKP